MIANRLYLDCEKKINILRHLNCCFLTCGLENRRDLKIRVSFAVVALVLAKIASVSTPLVLGRCRKLSNRIKLRH